VEHITEGAFHSGVTLDGPSTSLSFKSYINLIPDAKAVYLDPLASVPTAAIVCDLYEPPDSAPVALGVRQTLRSSVNELAKIDPNLKITMGAEAEFFLLEADGKASPEEDLWQFLNDLARTLQEAGIKSEGFRYGPARGQGRVQMRWADPVQTADNLMLYRWFARSLARARGKAVTFQQNAPAGQGAASMPVHHTLWLGEKNAFHDENGWQYTSELCRHYVGGILNHAWAISAFVGSEESSFPLRSGALASALKPYLSAKSPDALVRVPERMVYAAGRRVKTRAGGAGGNPYLSLAAMLLAGIDGIKKRIEPDMEPKSSMPGTLDDALRGLHEDREFLKQGGFTDRLVDAWIAQRRESPFVAALDA
jgi:glutamine synthetase